MKSSSRFAIGCLTAAAGIFMSAILLAETANSHAIHSQQTSSNAGDPQQRAPERLELGKPLEKELSGGDRHSYQVTLTAGQFLHVVVEQRGIDVVVALVGPEDKQLIEVDSPNGSEGPEPLKWIVETAGMYRLEVRSLENAARPGRYEVKMIELRAAAAGDRELVEADKFYNESIVLGAKGQFTQALRSAERALELRRKALGASHPDVATSLNRLATLYIMRGDPALAEPFLREALTIREEAQGPEHPETANAVNNLAFIYDAIRAHAKATPLHRRALAIKEKTQGPEHPETATALNNLAENYRFRGDYSLAGPLHRRALAIREKTLGVEHPETADSLNNLALLYYQMGDYAQAEPLYRRALEVNEKVRGAQHPATANSLNNLALLYYEKGDNAQAEPLYRRALEINEKTRGAEHPATANSLHNLASLYNTKGDYAQAEELHRRALVIREKRAGLEHPDTAESLSSLALVYFHKGDYAQAEQLCCRALAIREKTLGPEHPHTAILLNNLALIYYHKGDNAQAEPLFRRALAAGEKMLGAEHPFIAVSLNNLSRLKAAMGDIPDAVALRSHAQANEERNIAINIATGSERQKLAYLEMLSTSSYQSVDLHVRFAPDNPTARDLALSTVLQHKGRVLDVMSDTVASLRRRARPEDHELFDRWTDTRARLARLVFGSPATASPTEYRDTIKQVEESVEKLEAEIGARYGEFRARSQPVTLAAVQSAIPADAALVEFFAYRPSEPKIAEREKQLGPPRYVAYVLQRQGEAKWVELGEARPIDGAIDKLRQALRDSRRRDVMGLARTVDRMVMQPVRPLLGAVRHVLISPDGSLNLIPFAALVNEHNQYLVGDYTFSYLTSGRDLLRLQVARASNQPPLIVANPDFGLTTAAQVENGPEELKKMSFNALPWTIQEAGDLKKILPNATLLIGARATETALKQARAPRLLHIATHGFFLQSGEKPPENTRGIAFSDFSDLRSAGRAAQIENPLLRSGLALAGFNERRGGNDDGVLTAMEAANLDLWGTKLVALSACDTGVGEVKNGEGVYGLRRALALAGAETQVMSLWPVSERETRNLMVGYYQRLLNGEGRGEALRQVQLEMLKDPRQRHPHYWASFIQAGEWANLDGKR